MHARQSLSWLTVLSALAVFLAPLGCAAGEDAVWTTHKTDEGNYTARFPAKPAVSSQEIDTAAGKMVLYTAAAKLNGAAYTVTHVRLPAAAEQAAPDQILEGAKSGIAGRGAKIASSKKVTLSGYPGLELQGKDATGMALRARVYLVKATLYQVILVAKDERQMTDDTADQFLRSFELLKPPAKR